jgi:GNAT superfamily N-acetyltransferase
VENLKIRRLRAEDAGAVAEIYSAIAQAPEENRFERVITDEVLRYEDAVGFVAEMADRVVGYIITYSPSVGFGMRRSAWIALLGVLPDHMGQGIGKQMAEAVFKFYADRGIHTVYTTVRWYQTDLLSFFRTLGFDQSDFINLRRGTE